MGGGRGVRNFLTGACRHQAWRGERELLRSGENVRERVALSEIVGRKTCAQP